MARKIQVPSVGGLRKVIAGTQASTATTIQGLEGQSLTIAQLAQLLGTIPSSSSGTSASTTGGSGSTGGASLVLGPGLAGGGPLLGNVNVRLTAVMPYLRRTQEGPRGRRGFPGQSGSGSSGGGSLTVTDGTHAVAGVTQLTLAGAVVSGSTPNATATISGGGGTVVNNFIMRRRVAEESRRRGPPGLNGTSGGGGGSWNITDGTHSVSNVTSLTVSGATVGGSAGAATLAISGGGSMPVPESIGSLCFWIDISQYNRPVGAKIQKLSDLTPATAGPCCNFATSEAVLDAQLNGLSTLALNGYFQYIGAPFFRATQGGTTGVSYFFVFKPGSSFSNAGCLLGGSGNNGVALYAGYLSGSPCIGISNSGIAALANASTNWTANTWYQANVTYNAATGAYAFRMARAAAGSGTCATGAGNGLLGYIGGDQGGNNVLNNSNACSFAEIIAYDGVVASGDITMIETYLNTKWGV